MLDHAVTHDKCQPLYQPHAFYIEGRQSKRRGEAQVCVAQKLKGEMQPICQFALIRRRLSAQSIDC